MTLHRDRNWVDIKALLLGLCAEAYRKCWLSGDPSRQSGTG